MKNSTHISEIIKAHKELAQKETKAKVYDYIADMIRPTGEITSDIQHGEQRMLKDLLRWLNEVV